MFGKFLQALTLLTFLIGISHVMGSNLDILKDKDDTDRSAPTMTKQAMKKEDKNHVRMLTTLKDHTDILKEALKTAAENIIIISPYISKNAINNNYTPDLIEDAQRRGVKVRIYTDEEFDLNKSYAEEGRGVLRALLCDLRIVKKVHAKTLIVDDKWIVTGSFNWLSASRDESSVYCRVEHSILLRGKSAEKPIKDAIKSIEKLVEKVHPYSIFYEKYIGDFFLLKDSEDFTDWWRDHEKYFSAGSSEELDELKDISDKQIEMEGNKVCSTCGEVCDKDDKQCTRCSSEFSDQSDQSSESPEAQSPESSKEMSRKELRDMLYNKIEDLYKKARRNKEL